jgi:hypothetical protein
MANTTNFNWETPDDTDLVKDGAAAIRTLAGAIDTSLVDLKGGTSGQILAKATNTNMDFVWVTNDVGDITEVVAGTGISGGGTSGSVTITNTVATEFDAKGDLVVGTGADTFDKLTVGANDTVLTADSTTATGLKWAAAAGGSSGPTFRVYRASTDPQLTINTATKVQFNAEDWDTDNCFDSTTNYRFTANKAGYYQFNTSIAFDTTGAVGRNELVFYKNGAQNTKIADGPTPQSYGTFTGSVIIYLNGTTDYVEVYLTLGAATDRAISNGSIKTSFTGVWIRS